MSTQPPDSTAPMPQAPPPPPSTAPSGGGSKKWVALGLAAVLVAGGVAFAAVKFFAAAEDDAVKIAPADSFVYFNAFLEPSNGQKMAIEDLLKKFPDAGTPEQAKQLLEDLLDEAFADSGLTYTEDIEPWLGKQIAFSVALPPSEGEDPAFALFVATEDEDATRDAIAKGREHSGDPAPDEESYEGVDYEVNEDDSAVGFVESFFVVGSNEEAFQSVVDASKGDSLADADRYQGAIDNLTDDRLALFYFDGKGLIESVPGLSGVFAGSPLGAGLDEPVAGALYARSDKVIFEFASTTPADGAAAGLFGSADDPGLLPDLPAEAWGAFGVAGFGDVLEGLYNGLANAGIPGINPDLIREQLRAQFGIDIEEDILSWIGDLGLWIQGTDFEGLGGGAILEVTDPAAAAQAVVKFEDILRRMGAPVQPLTVEIPSVDGFAIQDRETPQPINVVVSVDRFVVAYGDAATIAAFGPGLTTSTAFASAQDSLGEGFTPTAFFDVATILELVDNMVEEPDPVYVDKVRPNLEPIAHIVFGSRVDGDTVVQRLVIGVP